MLKEKAALFTIGQFAALHEINKKTLMWYDEIGLLKPACIKETAIGITATSRVRHWKQF